MTDIGEMLAPSVSVPDEDMPRPKTKLALHRNTQINIVKPNYTSGFLRILVYGDSGVGKTVLAASAADVPELCPVLFCDADRGTMSIAERTFDVVELTSLKDAENVRNFIIDNPGKYKTVVLDSLTALYDSIMIDGLGQPGKRDDPYVPSQQDWLRGHFRLHMLVEMFKFLPVNFIATAQVDERIDELSGLPQLRPALSRKLSRQVGAEFDIVGYMYSRAKLKEVERFIQVAVFGNKIAKSRGRKLPPVILNPTMKIIYAGAITGSDLPAQDIKEEVKE